MKRERLAFDFIDIDLRPGKPRTTGLTIVRDRMRSLGEQRDFLETYAEFVDYVKISNMAPRLYPEAFLKKKLDLFTRYDVMPFFGGIMFENAYAQGKVEQLFDYLSAINAPALEISDNIISISEDELCAHIATAKANGMVVFVEWGEKYPEALFDVNRAIDEIRGRLDAGAHAVIFERAELDQIFQPEQHKDGIERLARLRKAFDRQELIFEAETRAQMVGLLDAFGRDVNLGPNIDFEEVKWLEPSRLGVSREMGHSTIEKTIGKRGVRSSRDKHAP